MKKILFTVVALFLASCLSVASAATYTTLRDLQNFILPYSNIIDNASVEITGTIADIYHVTTNHYEMIIEVDEANAINPIGHEKPFFIAHFRLHIDLADLPFAIGDTVTIAGTVNGMYSSFMNPDIMVSTVNGSDDF